MTMTSTMDEHLLPSYPLCGTSIHQLRDGLLDAGSHMKRPSPSCLISPPPRFNSFDAIVRQVTCGAFVHSDVVTGFG